MNKLLILGTILILATMTASAVTFSKFNPRGNAQPYSRNVVLPGRDFARDTAGSAFTPPAQCAAEQTRCAGRVFRSCLNGKWINKQLCHASEECMTGRGCVQRKELPPGLAQKTPRGEKAGRYILEKGKSERRAQKISAEAQTTPGKKRVMMKGFKKSMQMKEGEASLQEGPVASDTRSLQEGPLA